MITQKELEDLIDYNFETGIVTWKVRMNGAKAGVGEEAGTTSCGYRRIQINNKRYMAHILIWIWVMGEPPEKLIDHEDGNTLNNSWKNLREADDSQNAFNRKRNSNNTSGIKGVHYHKGQDMYHSYVSGKHIGSFDTKEEAEQAVTRKRLEVHGLFAKQ